MRNPVSFSLSPAVTGISVGGMSLGDVTVSGMSGTYTPFSRIPRWPETIDHDSFFFTGIDAFSNTVKGVVYVTITVSAPTGSILATQSLAGSGGGTQAISINFSSGQTSLIPGSLAYNSLATNNVDGIVLSYPGGTDLAYWDPVSNVNGLIDLTNILNFSPVGIANNGGGTYDNDNEYLYIFVNLNDSGAGSDPTNGKWFYRISFATYITGSVPIIRGIDRGRIYTNLGLTTQLLGVSQFGDVAWDPITKRTYLVTSPTAIVTTISQWGYLFLDGMEIAAIDATTTPDSPILGVYFNALAMASVAGVQPTQITFIYDGTILYGMRNASPASFTINTLSTPSSSLTPLSLTMSVLDVTTWPATLKVI